MSRKHVLHALIALSSLAGSAASQTCAPVTIPLGQPALIADMPVCVGVMPLPLPPGGNPGFALSTFVPAAPAGSPTYLLLSGFSPPPFMALPAPILCGGFGLPGTIPMPVGGFPFLIAAGPAGPGPGAPVSLPIPGGIPPGSLFLAVQTVVAIGGPFGMCIGVTNGITVTN